MGVFELIGWVVAAHTFAVMLTVVLCLHPRALKDVIILHLVQSHFINSLPSLLPVRKAFISEQGYLCGMKTRK